MLRLPSAARTACWINAWLAGREGADAAISGLAQRGAAVEFVGPEPGTRRTAALFLGELRRWGVRRASCALPVPGDPLGLGGPAEFNIEVIAATEGVVLHGPDVGLVPSHAGSVISWLLTAARPPTHLPPVGESARALRTAMARAADELATLDVAKWRPEVAEELIALREPGSVALSAPFATPDCARLAGDALRAGGIVTLARASDGGAVSAWEAERRLAALQPLDRAARTAIVAATSSYDGR